jgi:hypothetical protein
LIITATSLESVRPSSVGSVLAMLPTADLETAYVVPRVGCRLVDVSFVPEPEATPVTAMPRTPIDANDASR